MDLPERNIIAGRYELLAPLAKGGAGATYKAYDTGLGRFVALKVISADTSEAASLFRREARVSQAIKHPNVLSITDAGLEGSSFYLVSELVEGGSLSDLLRRTGPLSLYRALGAALLRSTP